MNRYLAIGAMFVGALATSAIAQPARPAWRVVERLPLTTDSSPICLYQDAANGNRWTAAFDQPPGAQCELVRAATGMRVVGLATPGFAPRGHLAGTADGICDRPTPGYSVCASRFFKRLPSSGIAYVKAALPEFQRAVEEANVFGLLEDRERQQMAAKSAADRDVYRADYEAATTPEAIKAFKSTYAAKDPDGLLAQLGPRLAALERDAYIAATSANGVRGFIQTYRDDDPAGLVVQAQTRLASLEAKEKSANALAAAEQRIINCKRMTTVANQAIAREQQIGAVSGYVDKQKLHTAGDYIVSCQGILPSAYAEYKRLGGTKTLAAIQ